MTTFSPDNADQVAEVVAWAAAESEPLALRGTGTKASVGQAVNIEHELDLSKLSGVTLYEPDELVLQAGPATPMDEINKLLADHGQALAFEPPDLGPLLTGAPAAGSLGGVIAANLAGPRRIKSGAARDHFLGFNAVSGRGESFKSGGRVVKNVTGYDLCKLMCGSWGTLAAMTSVTVKVLPVAPKERTVLVATNDAATAVKALTVGLNSPLDVSGAGWLPASMTATSPVDMVRLIGKGVAALRLEGIEGSIVYRCDQLRNLLGDLGTLEELHTSRSRAFWQAMRDVQPFAGTEDKRPVWKISVAPQDGPAVLAALEGKGLRDAFMDWGGGLIWLAVPADLEDAGATVIREAVNAIGGHAMLMRASPTLRAAVPVFHPQNAALAALGKRIRDGFDPHGILNPGRMG